MRKVLKFAAMAVGLGMLAGCTYTTAHQISPGELANGFVYYECKPLLVVNGSSTTIAYVKNPNKRYAVQFGEFLSKNHVALEFNQDCGLAKVDSDMDSTAAIPLVQSVLEKALGGLPTKPVNGSEAADSTAMQVYDVVFNDAGELVGLRPLVGKNTLVRVPAAPSTGG